ncbi:hypothetical protein CC1G_00363 [Coprinopsis cinerea okayama7|uniref:Sister chromatid cohesion protein DCC1 n=1 Tax=Coprinopsis cinerea (strain Okayama-7 / 130 / ATCC MYA-4618 / FGSC 9003) TaxID=240176 RepID=D6RMX2_COPC7|nr:hypothetical protein CC1G_00363 [Coprinopsis cinerea okayama7\|eukprot:XP_002911213.1 hypothetical protein CC1G_00363 [Coprinopsis cinerea okayama7\
MSSEYALHFSPISTEEAGSFKLLELSQELAALVETAIKNSDPLSLNIKGNSNEDAVLCTRDKTYTIRSVDLSNTLLIVTPPEDAAHSLELAGRDDTVVIRDQINEILELAPAVPKIQKLISRIRSREYGEDQEDEDETDDLDNEARFTYEQAQEEIQASDVELDSCLKQRRILVINRELRPIAPAYLQNILELILNLLVSLSQPHSNASVEALTSSLSDDHEISRVVSTQVLAWFGEIHAGKWKMDVDEVIKELGLGILRNHKDDPIAKRAFLSQWKEVVGDTFADRVTLKLIAGNYLEHKSSLSGAESLQYFPSLALPPDPAARFADLFLTRAKWKGDEISAFLNDIAVNTKERDKLLLKYCRAITEEGTVYYTARAQYSG